MSLLLLLLLLLLKQHVCVYKADLVIKVIISFRHQLEYKRNLFKSEVVRSAPTTRCNVKF